MHRRSLGPWLLIFPTQCDARACTPFNQQRSGHLQLSQYPKLYLRLTLSFPGSSYSRLSGLFVSCSVRQCCFGTSLRQSFTSWPVFNVQRPTLVCCLWLPVFLSQCSLHILAVLTTSLAV
ncbi:hypothetical protein BC835DRAFT_1361937 [Cytidiella melzeri]|nr:hypothetical protein BC835DRAFT_1361937 [Cytidiella melzeri]